MKEVKSKHSSAEVTSSSNNMLQKATEEQMRYAKLSQLNHNQEERKIQEKIKKVSEVTGAPPDLVSIALHDSHYDTSVAIQSILDGACQLEQDEWETKTKNRRSRKNITSIPVPESFENANKTANKQTSSLKQNNIFDSTEGDEQKTVTFKPARLSKNAAAGGKGRSSSRNWRNEDRNQNDDKEDGSYHRDGSRDRMRSGNERGRGRGRGSRGGFRGGRGGRGGFGRGGGGGFRGSRQGGRLNKGGFSKSQDPSEKLENGELDDNPPGESWDIDIEPGSKIEDWSEDVVNDDNDSNWAKPDWAEPIKKESSSLFSTEISWSQLNGNASETWNDELTGSTKDDRTKYIPENIDTAVIRSVPTSSTAGEVTSYQPTGELNRYITSASNQFPSSHQEGGLTSSLNDRAFSLPPNSNYTESVKRTVATMPMVSGVTESHKLEQEQLHVSKPERSASKSRKAHVPTQPVVMPRSAQMMNDIEEQFSGLEFGSVQISPGVNKHNVHDKTLPTKASISSLREEADHCGKNEARLLHSNKSSLLPEPSNQLKPDIPKTPPGFKPLDQKVTHSIGSPARTLSQLTNDHMSFSASKHSVSPPVNSSALNIFSHNDGLGKIMSESYNGRQRSLPEQKYLSEQQRELTEREQLLTGQRAFAEQKSRAHHKLISTQRSQEDAIQANELSDQKNLAENRLGLVESKVNSKLTSANNTYLSTKVITSTSSSRGTNHLPNYNTTSISTEMLGLTSATGIQPSVKAHTSNNKVSVAPPSMIPQMNLYAGVQHGMVPTYQPQPMTSYNYEELLQMRGLPVSPYAYDVSVYPTAQAPPQATTRDGLSPYQGGDSKFPRGTDESPVSLQGNPHVAGNLPAQAYLNAASQLPYGYTYYQTGVLPQGGVFPSAIYQVQQGKTGAQYQPPFQQQGGYNSKFSGGASDFSKTSFHTSGSPQAALSQHGKPNLLQTSNSTTMSSTAHQPVPQSGYKPHYNQDGKGFLGNSPTSLHAQANMHLHNTHLSHFLLQQQVGNPMATHHHVDPTAHRNQVHPQMSFSGNQQKRDHKGSYPSYWSATNR